MCGGGGAVGGGCVCPAASGAPGGGGGGSPPPPPPPPPGAAGVGEGTERVRRGGGGTHAQHTVRDRAQRVGGSPGTPLNTGRIPVCVCVPSPGGVRLPGPPRTSSITITAFGAAGAARSPVTTGGWGGARGPRRCCEAERGRVFWVFFFFGVCGGRLLQKLQKGL